MARIQRTVLLTADICEESEIVKLELIGGPIELAGSAVNAVRQWKYRPYLMNGVPVAVRTEIQVNYRLAGYQPQNPVFRSLMPAYRLEFSIRC